MLNSVGNALEVVKSALFGFLNPFLGIVVAVEYNSVVLFKGSYNEPLSCALNVLDGFETVGEFFKLLGYRGVEDDVGARDISGRAEHSELEAVACEREGRCAVAVGGILAYRGEYLYAEIHTLFALALVLLADFDRVYYSA